MRRSFTVAAAFSLLLVAVPLSSAWATPPIEVSIEVESSLVGDPAPFVASGAAVDKGLICSEGTVVDAKGKATGFSPAGFNFQGVKHFICEDGSGDFFINLEARIDVRRGVTFNWNVLRGTDDYVKLHGAGNGIGIGGVPCGDPSLCVLDIYDGALHLD